MPLTFCFSASCGKSIHVPHLRALRGCSLVSSKLLKSRKSVGVWKPPPLHYRRLFTGSLFQAMDTFFWSVFPLLLGVSTGNLS